MITVQVNVRANAQEAWKKWNDPESISQWAFASDDWGADVLENSLNVGGTLKIRNYNKHTSEEFILGGVYTDVTPHEYIEYVMDDERKVQITFVQNGSDTIVTETFDAEDENSEEVQRQGWQATLENFKRYVERGDTANNTM